MANRRFIDFPIASSVGDNDIVLIWQDGMNKQTTKGTLIQGAPTSLEGLTDVDIAGLINGQILQYNSTTSKWENVDRTDINLSELGDVSIVSPSNGQVLVYNSSTSKWENSSGGYVPYTGAVTTVNLGAQSILAGSFVKAGGTSSQFLKADGSVDSNTYGTGTVTSVGLTMPSAFSVANTPVTTAGTLAVTGAGTTAQYIRGDGTLATFPALTGFVPYTGATADVNLGTHDLAAERGTFTNNGSSDTLTVNHSSGSGYGIIVTKGGANEALYVSKTSGSGNAMTVVGGRTSLVDLALSSVSNTAGDFLTLSGGVVHKRTAAQTLTDIGGQAALTNPVTGTGTTNYLAKFTGSTTVGNSQVFDNGTNVLIGTTTDAGFKLDVNGTGRFGGIITTTSSGIASGNFGGNAASWEGNSGYPTLFGSSADRWIMHINPHISYTQNGVNGFAGSMTGATLRYASNPAADTFWDIGVGTNSAGTDKMSFGRAGTNYLSITSAGNVGVGTLTPGAKLEIKQTANEVPFIIDSSADVNPAYTLYQVAGSGGWEHGMAGVSDSYKYFFSYGSFGGANSKLTITSSGNVGIGTTAPQTAGGGYTGLHINGNGASLVFSTIEANLTYLYTLGTGGIDFAIENSGAQIFRPGGSERMRITSSGNVGIGTSSPAVLLHLNTTDTVNNIFRISNGTQQLNLGVNNSGGGSFIFESAAQALRFGTSDIERARITSGGNVLIGTTTDVGNIRLQVAASASSWISQTISGSGGTNKVVIGNYNGLASIGGHNAALNAWANLAINFDGGNVLIGTTTDAGYKLDVAGAIRASDEIYINNGKYLRLQRSSGGLYIQTLGIDSGTDNVRLLTTGNFNIVNGSLTNLMIVKNNGNVGIGTTTEDGKLAINTNNTGGYNPNSYNGVNANIRLTNGSSGSGRYTGIAFTGSGSTEGFFGVVQNSSTLAEFVWQTYNGAAYGERMRMTSSGNVLINTTTDVGATLHVNGAVRTGAPSGGSAVNWKLGTSRGGTVTTNATVRVEIDGVLVDLVARYV